MITKISEIASYANLRGIQSIGTLKIELSEEELSDRNVLYEMYCNLGMWQSQLLLLEKLMVIGRYPLGFFDAFTQYRAVELVDYPGYGFSMIHAIHLESVAISGESRLDNLDDLWAKETIKNFSLGITNAAVMEQYSDRIVAFIQKNPLLTVKLSHCGGEEYKAIAKKESLQEFDIAFRGHTIACRVKDNIKTYTFAFAITAPFTTDEFNALLPAGVIHVGGGMEESSLQTIWLFLARAARKTVNMLELKVNGAECSFGHISEAMKTLGEQSGAGIGLLQVNYAGGLKGPDLRAALAKLITKYKVASINFHLGAKGEKTFVIEDVKMAIKSEDRQSALIEDAALLQKVYSKVIRELNGALGIVEARPPVPARRAAGTASPQRAGSPMPK